MFDAQINNGPTNRGWSTCARRNSSLMHRWPTQRQIIIAENHHVHGQRNYMQVFIQIHAFRRKPKKLKLLFSFNKKL